MSLLSVRKKVLNCKNCPRLREWSSTRAGTNPTYINENYWGLPVSGFGDELGKLLIVGLAPGSHGANRTGRPFTGDTAGEFLYKILYKYGFTNIPFSTSKEDGLELKNVYITNAVRCAPPDNKPNTSEFNSCRSFLVEEIRNLINLKVILTLGEKSFYQTKKALSEIGANTRGISFRHGETFTLGNEYPILVTSYHTSQYNIRTGVINEEMMNQIFDNLIRYVRE